MVARELSLVELEAAVDLLFDHVLQNIPQEFCIAICVLTFTASMVYFHHLHSTLSPKLSLG